MKLKTWAAVVIFVSSYAPLAVMLAILNFDFDKCEFKSNHVAYATLGIAALSVIVLWGTLKTLHGDFRVEVTDVKDRSNELLNYSLPYIASFYSGGLESINFLCAMGFFLTMIGWVSIRSQIVLVNPLLACSGYGLYEITYKDGSQIYERIVLSKTLPHKGETLKICPLTAFFVFGERT